MKTIATVSIAQTWNVTHELKRWLVILFAALMAASVCWIWMFARQAAIPMPDAKVAAMSLLAEKLSGPRYFNAPVTGESNAEGPWIRLEEVHGQTVRVIDERKFDGDQRARLERFITELSEPQPARMIGGYRIQLERLNLALDTLSK